MGMSDEKLQRSRPSSLYVGLGGDMLVMWLPRKVEESMTPRSLCLSTCLTVKDQEDPIE